MSRRARLLIALAAGLGILLLIGVALSLRGKGSGPATQDEIAAAFESDPRSRPWAVPLRTYYPREYRSLLNRVAAAHLSGGTDDGDRMALRFLDDFLARKVEAIANAPDAQLLEIVSAKAEMLRRDPDCNPPGVIAAGTWRDLVIRQSRVMGLMIAAARAGETSGRRPRRRWGPADYEALRARMEAMDPQLVRAPHETPALGCRYDLLMYRAMAELPPPVGPVVMAEFVRGWAAPR